MKTQGNLIKNVRAYLNSKGLWRRHIQKVFFLLELKYFYKYNETLDFNFKSYDYGPFSQPIGKQMEIIGDEDQVPKDIKDIIDEILKTYDLSSSEKQNKEFERLLKYIHSLFIYNVTPYNHKFDFSLFSKDDLLLELELKDELTGEKLKQEKASFKEISKNEKEKMKKYFT